MRPSASYERFAGDLHRETTIERLRGMVGRWMAYGLCEAQGFGEHCDRWFVNGAMSCETPVRIQYVARSSYYPDGCSVLGKPLTLEVLHRCRKCKSCERARSRVWAARAAKEFDQAERTWFGTLTLAPQHHAVVDAWVSSANLWPERSCLNDAQYKKALFRARASVVGEQVSTWLNLLRDFAWLRIRKREVIRYLLVAEKHDSRETADFMRGRPHFHLILHEVVAGAVFSGDAFECMSGRDNGELVRRKERTPDGWQPFMFASDDAFARRAWCLGHSKFKFCETPRAAHYICNYLYESEMTRMRASLHYGKRELPEVYIPIGASDRLSRRLIPPTGGLVSGQKEKRLTPPPPGLRVNS